MSKTANKRPKRDEFELEELANQLVEVHQEKSEVILIVHDADPVRGTVTKLDGQSKRIHVRGQYGDVEKVPFIDILKIEHLRS